MAKANGKVGVIGRAGWPFKGCRRDFKGFEVGNPISEWENGHWI
jgi:hypothetical protein